MKRLVIFLFVGVFFSRICVLFSSKRFIHFLPPRSITHVQLGWYVPVCTWYYVLVGTTCMSKGYCDFNSDFSHREGAVLPIYVKIAYFSPTEQHLRISYIPKLFFLLQVYYVYNNYKNTSNL